MTKMMWQRSSPYFDVHGSLWHVYKMNHDYVTCQFVLLCQLDGLLILVSFVW